MLCSEMVDVYWPKSPGNWKKGLANLEDISTSGVCLQMDRPLPIGTQLRIAHAKGEFSGEVRYCLYRQIGYFLGVEFAPGCTWSPQAYQPQHLLDLRKLLEQSADHAAGEPSDGPTVQ
jgi:hypothetical protein